MKIYKFIILVILILMAQISFAQPLPPTTPTGNPVPVGNLMGLVLLASAGIGYARHRFVKKN